MSKWLQAYTNCPGCGKSGKRLAKKPPKFCSGECYEAFHTRSDVESPPQLLGIEWVRVGRLHFAAVDIAYLPLVGGYRWRMHSDGYAVAGQGVYMHRLIVGIPITKAPTIDHIDGDKLNNRRANLRPATVRQNVNWSPRRLGQVKRKGLDKWSAQYAGRYLGLYATEEEARSACAAAKAAVIGAAFTPGHRVPHVRLVRPKREPKPLGVCSICSAPLGRNTMKPYAIRARNGAAPKCNACHTRSIAHLGGKACWANRRRGVVQ